MTKGPKKKSGRVHDIQTPQERVVICGIKSSFEPPHRANANCDEVQRLVETAGGLIVHRDIVNVREPVASTYIGKGKLLEIAQIVKDTDADLVVIDTELSGSQLRNLEAEVDARVVDRTELILDIFALHAHTAIGKLQVELAQLMHRKTKLRVQSGELSQLGGGIGTRGPGETKLEVDRRRIDDKISFLRKQLIKLHERKDVQRKQRQDPKVQHVAIVGYTNVGKSSLLNALTDAGVLAADKLFATLETTTRRLVLPCGRHVVLTDTVGFIRNLPHEIVEAFRSTFEEARQADLVLHLVDASNSESAQELKVGNEILQSMEVVDVPKIYVLTKKDLCKNMVGLLAKAPVPRIAVSSVSREGFQDLLEAISTALENTFLDAKLSFPPQDMHQLYLVRKHGRVLEEQQSLDGATYDVQARIPEWLHGSLKSYIQSP